ncbi:MAG: glycerol kinase, partial [Actinomycetia bacterium]|nr:glycerol kinase [Actinomycetes bacterium]
IFIAGAVMQWLRDKVNFFKDAAQSEKIALKEKRAEGLFLIPAFVGLGAPYWDMYARGSIMGLTRDTGISQIVRAALESIAFQTRDLVDIMESDGRIKIKKLRVDGGATANNYLMQFQADILNCIIEKPKILESTALGAAILAGLKTGYWKKIEDALKVNTIVRSFKPAMKPKERNELYSGWKKAVRRILT